MSSDPSQIERILANLPVPLRERCRTIGTVGGAEAAGDFVLYWMRTAVRVDENPALETAIGIANQLRLPVLVYHALSERYPFASDRHHTFIMEGARDLQASISDRNVGYVFHLERPGHRDPHLKELSQRAAVLVTEEMPVRPLDRLTQRLARSLATPLVSVDTACVVPMRLVGKSYTRAFAYRDATRELYAERVNERLTPIKPEMEATGINHRLANPLDLQRSDLSELVAECEIDHTIGPVPHTTGGSEAGYRRWAAFKQSGLDRYDRARNNPLVDGVSRISPYLHYGMVAPMRLAREAAEIGSKGAKKYLDELLIWRELAYAFCFYREDRDRLSAIPNWAAETLAEHCSDRRPAVFSWETLARGLTGDAIWDSAQRSLLIHGELHNNVRMTWGKALLKWKRNADEALKAMIDLNHRYALDGRDPSSYGGILWCLGQFDRPFSPPRKILGTVRDRSTRQHAERLDPKAYRAKVTRPLHHPVPRIAVIGAGLSGLMCARTLADHGCQVTVFEKSRGAGGRMATRRAGENLCFDHGAQYFTVRDPRFRRYVESWINQGLVTRWRGTIVAIDKGEVTGRKDSSARFVGVPGMNAIGKHLADGLNVQLQTEVSPVRRESDSWPLTSNDGESLGDFDSLVISAPAHQTAELLDNHPTLAEPVRNVRMSGCWAVMCAVENRLPIGWDGAFVNDSPLSWIARNSSKPERPGGAESGGPESWILHSSPSWSDANLERPAGEVADELLDEFVKIGGFSSSEVIFHIAHRWRYALPTEPLEDRCLFDSDLQAGVCGDWCGGPRVEGAFLSGSALAGRFLGLFGQRRETAASTASDQRLLF